MSGAFPARFAVSALSAICVLLLTACPEKARMGKWFVDEGRSRGLDFEHVSGSTGEAGVLPLLPEIVGGGAALADLDGDGDLDAYLVQSGPRPDRPELPRLNDQLFFNDGAGYFEPANVDAATGYGMGVAAGDYDADGDVDLYVTNVGSNHLLRNDGHGDFTDVAQEAGVDHAGWGTAAAFVDLDTDGDLDLFLVNYMNWSLALEKDCRARGKPTYCSPTAYKSPAIDRLYRNNGDGSFTDVTVAAGINRSSGNGLGLVVADFNNDGLPDLFVANDKTLNQFWINEGALRFSDLANDWGCAVDEHGMAKAGMGVGAGDVDDDGDVDVLVVNLEGETDSYFRNEGNYFADATAMMGLGAASGRHTRFGVALADFDNDGAYDIYEANGKVDGDVADPSDAFAEPNVLYHGTRTPRGHRFVALPGGGVSEPLVHTSRGVAIGDVDNDGGLDLLVVNRDARAYLLMNHVPRRGNWVRLKVLEPDGRQALGARVIASVDNGAGGSRQISREVVRVGSYLASNDPRVLVGLGDEERLSALRVRWIDGVEEAFTPARAGETVILRRGWGL